MGKMLYHEYVPRDVVFLIREIGNDKKPPPFFIYFAFQPCFVSTPLAHFYSDCVWCMGEKVVLVTHLTRVDPTVEPSCL